IDASTNSAPSTVSRFYQSNFIDPGETEYDALEEGLVYYLGTTDGQINEFLIRIDRKDTPGDPSDDELFVSRNGGETLVYTPLEGQIQDDGFSLNTIWVSNEDASDERQLYIRVTSSTLPGNSVVFFRENFPAHSIGPKNFGRGGLETQVAKLPNRATYFGNFTTNSLVFEPDPQVGNPNQLLATSTVAIETSTSDTVIDFNTGTIDGTHAGNSFLGAAPAAISGDISGNVDGSRVAGSLSITEAATGTLEFGGVFTGNSGRYLVGGVAGTVQQGGSTHDVGGLFSLSPSSSE
ncbi:MAG: hypothetical protein AAFX07_06255, partial [Pseudomonadota bacterium]